MKKRILLCCLFSIMLLGKGISQGSGFSFSSFIGIDLYSADPITDFKHLSTDYVISDVRSRFPVGLEFSYYLKRSSLKYYVSYRFAHRVLRTTMTDMSLNNNVGYNQHTGSLGLIYSRKLKKDNSNCIDFAFDLGLAGHTNAEYLFDRFDIVDGVAQRFFIDIRTWAVIPVFSLSCQYVHAISTNQSLFVGFGLFGQLLREYDIGTSLWILQPFQPTEISSANGARFRIWTPIFKAGINF